MFITKNQLEEVKSEALRGLHKTLESVRNELSEVRFQNDKEIDNIKKDNQIILERKDKEIDNKLYEKTNSLRVENDKLRVKEANLQKEVDILNKAFENLGFDVKDMKDILNKLVDGLVAKNQINLVKTN